MLCASRPLNLWAPSSVILKSRYSGLSPTDFLEFVDQAKIRVFGRREWLTEPGARDLLRWSRTSWEPDIDDTLRRWALEDESKPQVERRVVIALPETGYDWADQYLSAHPEEVKRWHGIAKSKARRQKLPGGTRQAIEAVLDDPLAVARRILRDAHNHGRAIYESQSHAPFLLQTTYRDFLKVLAEAPMGSGEDPSRDDASPPESQIDTRLSGLTAQLMEILRELDVHGRGTNSPDRLKAFLASEAHGELAQWMEQMCLLLRFTDPSNVDGLLLADLRKRLADATFKGQLRSLLDRKDETTVCTVGLVTGLVGLLTDPTGAATILGIAASVYPLGKGLARELGYAPATFSGPQWPFLYAYGSEARKRQLISLKNALEQI